MADVFFFLPFEGVEPVCLQLFCHAPRQLEACREAHQLGFNQQCVLRIQQSQQLLPPCGVHVPPQFLLGAFDLLVQFTVFLTVEMLLQGFHVVIHCGTVTNGPGGGIESLQLSSSFRNHLELADVVLTGNHAAKGGGICLYNDTSTGTMEANFSNTVITENTATELGGGFFVEADSNATDSTAVTFNESCAVYDNTANSGADDFYKNGNSTVNALPTAEQMSAAAKNAVISGWYKDEEGNRYSKDNASEYTPVDSTTDALQLKAVKAAQYNVIFDWNDGSSTTATVSALAGTALGDQMPAAPTRSGYTFTGWNTQADGQGTVFNKDTVVNGTLTVYAQWNKNSGGGGGGSTTYYYFAIEKVDAQDGHALNGAKFGLYLDEKQVATATSNRSGIALFRVSASDYRKINAKSELYYQELTAPEGYVVSGGKIDMEKDVV